MNGYIFRESNFLPTTPVRATLQRINLPQGEDIFSITLFHSEEPKLYGVLAVLSAIGLKDLISEGLMIQRSQMELSKFVSP